MLTSEQIRAARAMLRIEQRELAEKSGVSLETIKRIEKTPGAVSAYASTVDKLQRALEGAGIEFINGGQPGVCLRIVGAWPARRDGDGEWGVVARWKIGDPAEWATIEVARVAAAQAESAEDQRLAAMLRRAADDAERHAAQPAAIPSEQLNASNDG